MILHSRSEAQTERLGAALAACLPDGTVVALYGDLGAGKTAFVRGMARGMGLRDRVSSPTFTIVNEYLGDRELYHFDMYRLNGAEELFDIGWEDYLGRKGVCAVEWSENVAGAFDGSEVKVSITRTGELDRELEILPPPGLALGPELAEEAEKC
ncbi:MAG: tRNA (adenosine(37)-N6)-threonylcarbamoyltransferase complex ATPase subunit type 1 TsaE [Oscillospiraceae bacterium]|nr:tRNA (adenosine(37)-N6)-threonylcarbamoyltransferase complex ATPase subunit type 1 TsaE [Oscillospiraceae bacterium]